MKEMIKKLQQYITTIKTVVISKLCGSYKKEISTEGKNEENTKFWKKIRNEKMRRNIESLLLVVLSNLLIPLIPFLIEMQYGESHCLSQRTFIMGATMYCFSIAIFSERRLFNFLIICVGILIVSLYGSYKSTDYITTIFDFKIFLFFSVFITHLFERIIINIFENEKIKTFI